VYLSTLARVGAFDQHFDGANRGQLEQLQNARQRCRPSKIESVLPVRDIVVFPHMIRAALRRAAKVDPRRWKRSCVPTLSFLATQKTASDDDPQTDSIFEVGTLASVLQLLKLPDGTVKVLVEGATRAKVLKYTDRSEIL